MYTQSEVKRNANLHKQGKIQMKRGNSLRITVFSLCAHASVVGQATIGMTIPTDHIHAPLGLQILARALSHIVGIIVDGLLKAISEFEQCLIQNNHYVCVDR